MRRSSSMANLFRFLSLLLTWQIYQCSCLLLNDNLCKYKKEGGQNDKLNILSKRSGLCDEDEKDCRRLFGWLAPPTKPVDDEYEDCCPGYTNRGIFGCQTKTCIVLPQHVNKFSFMCSLQRRIDLNLENLFYKLTTPSDKPLAYPKETSNVLKAVSFPLLNQPTDKLLLRSALKPRLREAGWLIHYLGMTRRNRELIKKTLENPNIQPFTNYSNYAQLLKSYREEQSKDLVSIKILGVDRTFSVVSMEKYMKYPSQELPFKDIIHNNIWQDDDVFTQQRLAGLNPMSLRRMTSEDFNRNFMHKTYDWDAAMRRASGEDSNFTEMIDAGRVYIADFPYLYDLTNVEDYTERNTTDRREMRGSRAPICTFVSANVGGVKELKPVAIQTDQSPDAPVFSPVDGSRWLMAKQEFQRADITHAELIEHLLKTHLLMEPICVIMRRTLSRFHPLHQILKWHCRGLFVVNSIGTKALLQTLQASHKLFAMGHVGAVELLNRGYPDMSWADTEFDKNLERRGVNSVEELPYFPYRDDGLVIWKEVNNFARDYVNLYYLNNGLVVGDSELKNFANQLSADGAGRNGGIGKLKGFPAKIESIPELIDVVKRIIFIPIQHHAVNYPVAYYGGFVPNLPTKLYDDPRVAPEEFGFDRLPQYHVAAEQVSLSMSLGSIRYDVLFDYGKHLKDDRAKAVVNKYYGRLTGSINDQISARNEERLKNGKLSYPYLLPKWMPNSIHT